METTRSPKFLGNPNSHPPCSPTPAGPQWQAICHLSAAPTYLNDKDPRINKSVEAQSHGCCDRCLRFTTAVTRGHARLASGCWPALPGWIDYQPGCSERFQLLHVLLSQALLGAIKLFQTHHASVIKHRLKDRFQTVLQGLLAHAVINGRDG